MITRRILQQIVSLFSLLLLLIVFGAASGGVASAQSATATSTPTPKRPTPTATRPTPTRPTPTPTTPTPPQTTGYFSDSQELPPIIVTSEPDPACQGGIACMPAPEDMLNAIQNKALLLTVSRTNKVWEVAYKNSFPPGAQVQLGLYRLLDSKNKLQLMDVSTVTSDDTGSIDIHGLLPEGGPGGKFVGVACTGDDCFSQKVLDNLGSSDVQVWQFDLEPLLKIDETALIPIQEPAPAIGVDF